MIYPASRQAKLDAVLRTAGWNRYQTFSRAIGWVQNEIRYLERH